MLGARARAPTRAICQGPQGLEFAADLKRAVDKVQRQESCPGLGGPYRPNLTVCHNPDQSFMNVKGRQSEAASDTTQALTKEVMPCKSPQEEGPRDLRGNFGDGFQRGGN